MQASPTTHERVPTFYSTQLPAHKLYHETSRRNLLNGTASAVGALFGGIHCSGWNFTFLSRPEKILWRLSSILIAGAPSFVALFYLMASLFLYIFIIQSPDSISRTTNIFLSVAGSVMKSGFGVVIIMVLLYIVARLCLLILALIALRNLSAGAYTVVEWAWFIPHI